jgi:polysaccharide export outer membrane protein
MNIFPRISFAMLLAFFGLAACGVTYTSPSIKEQGAGLDVRVVSLNAQTVLVANRAPYVPRSLPEAFFQTTGVGNLKSMGAIPQEPYVPGVTRESLELRVPPSVTPPPYRLGVGDVVLLATKSGGSTVAELSGLLAAQNQRQGYTLRDDGAIAIPDIGQIQLVGLTLQEAESAVFQALVERQIDPAFSLEVSQFNSKRVAVGGAVRTPTLVPITLNTLNLGEALNAAGGLDIKEKEFASIRIYRTGDLYQIPIRDFFTKPALQRLPLLSSDAIYVDTNYDLDRALKYYQQQMDVISLRQSTRSDALEALETEINIRRGSLIERRGNFQTREALGAEQRDYVYLTGEFQKNSRFTMPYNQQVTLADVLYSDGGYSTITADASEIYVVRSSTDPRDFGSVTAWHLNAKNAASITIAARMQMRPSDVVFIEEQPITVWARALGQFFPTFINIGARTALGY